MLPSWSPRYRARPHSPTVSASPWNEPQSQPLIKRVSLNCPLTSDIFSLKPKGVRQRKRKQNINTKYLQENDFLKNLFRFLIFCFWLLFLSQTEEFPHWCNKVSVVFVTPAQCRTEPSIQGPESSKITNYQQRQSEWRNRGSLCRINEGLAVG